MLLADIEGYDISIHQVPFRPASEIQRTATGLNEKQDAYTIRYKDIEGNPIPYYRIKVSNTPTEHVSTDDDLSYIYFTKNFSNTLYKKIVVITNSECRAEAIQCGGISACAIQGSSGWSSQTIIFPEDTKLQIHDKLLKNGIRATLPAGKNTITDIYGMAIGLQSVIQTVLERDSHIIFDFDSYGETTSDIEMSKNICDFSYFLTRKGISCEKIHQANIAFVKDIPARFWVTYDKVIKNKLSYPKCHTIKDEIRIFLHSRKRNRNKKEELAFKVLKELDRTGTRYIAPNGRLLYVKRERNKDAAKAMDIHKDLLFKQLMFTKFGISHGDNALLSWITSQFCTVDGYINIDSDTALSIGGAKHEELKNLITLLKAFIDMLGDNTVFTYSEFRSWCVKQKGVSSYPLTQEAFNYIFDLEKILIFKHTGVHRTGDTDTYVGRGQC